MNGPGANPDLANGAFQGFGEGDALINFQENARDFLELSNRGVVTVQPRRGVPAEQAPVVGRVSMDQTSIDLTGIRDVLPGDPVTITMLDVRIQESARTVQSFTGTRVPLRAAGS